MAVYWLFLSVFGRFGCFGYSLNWRDGCFVAVYGRFVTVLAVPVMAVCGCLWLFLYNRLSRLKPYFQQTKVNRAVVWLVVTGRWPVRLVSVVREDFGGCFWLFLGYGGGARGAALC